jgi:hypothetical protein
MPWLLKFIALERACATSDGTSAGKGDLCRGCPEKAGRPNNIDTKVPINPDHILAAIPCASSRKDTRMVCKVARGNVITVECQSLSFNEFKDAASCFKKLVQTWVSRPSRMPDFWH